MEQTVADAINIFYKLKGRYDKEGQKIKQKILNRQDLSLEEKRDLFQTQKRKCIKCKKPVGTIFKVEPERYIAMCGAQENPEGGVAPCNLDIQISRGKVELLPNYVNELMEKHKEFISAIMKIKFNLLFKYSSKFLPHDIRPLLYFIVLLSIFTLKLFFSQSVNFIVLLIS